VALNILRIIMRTIAIIGIIVLLANILLEVLPVLPNSLVTTVSTIHRVNQQGALAERIDKDVLILAYRPDAEHAQAVSELQVTLPVFEKIQIGLQNGDSSLNLPMRRPADVQLLLLQTQSDYAAIDAAAQSVLANAGPPVDQNELAIVVQHERPYFLAMSTVAKIWEGHIEDNALGFFWTELWIGIILMILWIASIVLSRIAQRKGNAHEPTSPTTDP